MPNASPSQRMADALACARRGATDQARRLYEDALFESAYRLQNVGLHLRMLEEIGQGSMASDIRQIALRQGADVSVQSWRASATAHERADEYLRLFEQGHVNAWMVSKYLLELDRLGRVDELRCLLDPRLVRQIRLDAADPTGRESCLADAARAAVLDRERGAKFEHETQAFRDLINLPRLQDIPDPVFHRVIDLVCVEVARLIADPVWVDHPVGRWRPSQFSLRMWALTSRDTGFTERHVHTGGWYTGTYYATEIEPHRDGGGALRIGRPDEVSPTAPGWPDLTIWPQRGLLILMPSYFTHWTVPLGRPGLRIVLPFDVIDLRTGPSTTARTATEGERE